MADEVVVAQTFEQKMKSKIRDSIGDLISEEELSKMVTRSMEEIFFTPRKNPKKDYYNSREPDTLPPLIHEIVKECLQPAVNTVVNDYVKTHSDEVLQEINKVVTAGVGNAMITAMNTQFQNQLNTFQINLINQLSSQPR